MNARQLAFTFGNLDPEHVQRLAAGARATWEAGVPVFELNYEPGDLTRYCLVFAVLRPGQPIFGATGGGTVGHVPTSGTRCPLDGTFALVSYVQAGRCTLLGNRDFVAPEAVRVTLTENEASSLALAVLLNAITGQDPAWTDRYVADAAAREL